MKKILIFFMIFGVANAANKELPKTPENCSRVTGMSTGLAEMIAQTLKVSYRSVEFLRAEHGTGPYGDCAVVVDTPVGIRRCSYMWILDSGNGKPFAGTLTGPGEVPCGR